jgi:hypothetical protein
MQNTVSLPADRFDDLLRRLPAHLDLDTLARQTKAIERKREIDSGIQIMRLALARGPGGLSLAQTAAWATMLGLAEMSDPAVKYRLDKHAPAKAGGGRVPRGRDCLPTGGSGARRRGALGRAYPARCGWQLLPRARQQDDQLAAARGLRPRPRRFLGSGTDRQTRCRGDRSWRADPGRLGDRNFARAPALHRYRQESANQADFIVRVGWTAFSLIRQDGSAFDLITYLGTLPPDMTPHEVMLFARVGVLDPALPLRLIIRRKTPEATEATRETLRREASRKQKVLDPRSLVAAEFVILATSLPAEGYPAEEVLAVYRLRWQIELAFKRLKSLLRMDRIPTHTERASRSWLLAHLIMALLCDDPSQDFLESSP